MDSETKTDAPVTPADLDRHLQLGVQMILDRVDIAEYRIIRALSTMLVLIVFGVGLYTLVQKAISE